MFTGIVSGIGRIVDVRDLGAGNGFGKRLSIEAPPGFVDDTAVGDSIALSGACMTAVAVDAGARRFDVEVSSESLARTAGLGAEGEVNLEKALRADGRLDGHLVSGHVDGVGTVVAFDRVGESVTLGIAAPRELARFLAAKGSIAVDGTSLTVNRVTDDEGGPGGCTFTVNVIDHTARHTTIGGWRLGRRVNLEVDTVARYVERMLGMAADVAKQPSAPAAT